MVTNNSFFNAMYHNAKNFNASNPADRIQQQLAHAQSALSSHDLKAYHVSWDDSSRDKYSSVGRNITDLTLIAKYRTQEINMPMIRTDRFVDHTYDAKLASFNVYLPGPDRVMPLSDILSNPELLGISLDTGSFLCAKDEQVCSVRAQACFLQKMDDMPSVEFVPELYNYQSNEDHPAVLVLVISSMGVSAYLPGKKTRLFHNHNGQEAWLKATGLSHVRGTGQAVSANELTADEKRENRLLIVQIPLKVPRTERSYGVDYGAGCAMMSCMASDTVPRSINKSRSRGLDAAKVSEGSQTGKAFGVLSPNKAKKLKRDESCPITITIQYYHLVNSTDLNPEEIAHVAQQLKEIQKISTAEGSNVVESTTNRPTDPANRTAAWKNRDLF